MTTTPWRCANGGMVQRSTHEVVFLNTGNYPSYSNYLNDTFTWNGTAWTETQTKLIDPNGPVPGRSQFTISYDGTNVMVYGGQGAGSGQIFQDTYLWNGTTWSLANPTTKPFGRFGAKADYISGTGVVMYGGFGGAGNGVYLDETWTWSGSAWTKLSLPNGSSPLARTGHCLASSGSTIIMFGGGVSSGQVMNDTWKFTSGAWTKLTPATSPSCRTGACMAYDSTHSVWVMFGGMNEYTFLPETWTFNGTTWTKQAPATTPTGRIGAQMCWDSQSGKVLMFGGIEATAMYPGNDTWEWSGTNWTKVA